MDKERILAFLEGRKSLQILSDRFFKKILDPEYHPERLGSLLSAIFGQKVTVENIEPREGFMISESGSQVVMDIIVRLSDGSMANVEMQRIGYKFPGERTSCYLSDMIMRQYNLIRSQQNEKEFSYKNIPPVRLIVIMDQSSKEFLDVSPEYIHTQVTSYTSKAKVRSLENVTYISLDTFREQAQNEINTELDAWLTFFAFEDPEHVLKLVDKYPEFLSLYNDIAEFRKQPEEVFYMFSEALKIMDRNTTKYMIDELKQAVVDAKQESAEKDKTISEKDKTISELTARLAKYEDPDKS